MTVRAVEWKKPYTWWKAIEITEDKVINLRLRDENNLIIYDEWDNEIYVDLQLPDEITPTDAFPVWVTTGRVIVDNGWDWQGTIVCFKTTSWDSIKLLYADDWKLYIDNWTGTFKQIYLKWEIDALLQALRDYVDQQLALKQDKIIAWDRITINADGKTINADLQVNDTAYWSSWDWVTEIAPSKNAVYDKIESIDELIPSAAASNNQLADKNYVDDSINQVAAYYITKNAQGDAFATKSELTNATTFYSWWVQRTPTRNDFCIVLADETHSGDCTRYTYQNNQWEYQYTINNAPMTQAQVDAINSWITANKVSTYDGYASTIAWKQDALTAGSNISITASQWITTISATDTTYTAGDWINISNQNVISVDWTQTGVLVYSIPQQPISLQDKYVYSWTATPWGDTSEIDILTDRVAIKNDTTWWDQNRVYLDIYQWKWELYVKDKINNVTTEAEYMSDKILSTWTNTETYEFQWGWNNQIARLKNIPSYSAWTWINIDASNAISNTLPWPVVSATAPSSPSEWDLWYDTTNDVLKSYNGTSWEEWGTKMTVLKYGTSTWQDFLNAYNNNAIVYCRVASWTSWYRMAFMAYIAGTSTPTSVEFQYYRSRSDHNTQANQLDEVYVYKLENNWTWTTTTRDTWAKIVAWNNVSITRGGWNAVINASWWIQNDTTWTTSTVTGIWAWTEAEFNALSNKPSTTVYLVF